MKKKKPNKKSEIILRVDWDDHCSRGNAWHTAADTQPQASKCISVGFLVKEDKKVLVLCQNKSDSDTIADTIHIVKSCITKRKKLA